MLSPLKLESFKAAEEACLFIIQLGTCWIRIGIRGDRTPRISEWIYETLAPYLNVQNSTLLDVCCSRSEWRPLLRKLFARVFGTLGEFPPDRALVVILESFRIPLVMREAIFDVLFEDFRVAAVHAAPDIIMPLMLQGQSTGIVIDFGHQEIRCVPVAFGVPIFTACRWSYGRGLQAVAEYFCQLQKESNHNYPNSSTPLPEISKIVNKYCYCKFECTNGFQFQLNNSIRRNKFAIASETRYTH
eukprot:Gregarina_sp_Poly_1__2766@NODE_1769_length_3377_cov_22_559215_g1_i2_p2_GENE_NODE_1769_length_3377_cov_22_559215_g1_i2NODE_1769_length_3377_cov_22_559215_g1_i2_p2_ORF_typecomplete_len244_score26_68Actin/PF00022_19/7_1e19PWI/PF01480_17/0_6PWI/PF01480_17/1_8e03_NODE_1769_length_3377_cov_22_559215_g1_i288819